jgi:nucleoside diphosphate kinase
MSNRTLVLLKPDAVERGLVGAITTRFESKGLRLVGMELRTLDKAILERQNSCLVAQSLPWQLKVPKTPGKLFAP